MLRRMILQFILPCAVAAVLPVAASAQTSVTSRTYVRSWETADGRGHLPIYEYLDLDSVIGKSGSLSIHAGGWARHDLGEELDGDRSAGELQYGYLSWRGAAGNRVARLGRQEVTGGVAATERIDGLSLGGDLPGGFAGSAYAGVPLETDGDARDGDSLYGGRISHRVPGFSEVGLSYLKERNDGDEFREEAGVDVFLRPHRMLSLDGRSVYSPDLSTWMEHQYRAVVQPLPALSLAAEYQDVDYQSAFRSASVSAFLPAFLQAEKGMRLFGAEAAYDLGPAFTAAISWRGYSYDVAGDAQAVGGRLGYSAGAYGAGLGYTRIRGDAPQLRYHEYRGYALRRAGRTELAVDVAALRYDEEIDGRDSGVTASLSAGYAVRPNLRATAAVAYVSDPVYSREVRGLLKLVYSFTLGTPKPGGAAR